MKSRFDLTIDNYEENRKFLFNKIYYIDSSDKEEDEYYFFNNVIFDETLNKNFEIGSKKESDTTKTKICIHSWKKYVGFTESYFYCENCDEKTFDEKQPPSSSNPWYLK